MSSFSADSLETFAASLLMAAGAKSDEAEIVASHLVRSNLSGHDSHGILRLIQYVSDIEQGRIVPGSQPATLADWPTGAILDASGAFGQVACVEAMRRAIDKSRRVGMAAVGVRHSNHSGRLGDYVESAAAHGHIGWVFANGGGGGQWVAPFGGRERRLSTNPIAFAAPSLGEFPLLVDISTSVAPEGKVRDLKFRGSSAPEGWLVDAQGRPTCDPHTLYASPAGALLPFGGSVGHKGFALSMLVDALAGALAGGGTPSVDRTESTDGAGLFFMAIDIRRFAPPHDFEHEVQQMMEYVKSSSPAEGFREVLVPGELEYRSRVARSRDGIEIAEGTWGLIAELADRLEATAGREIVRPQVLACS